MLPYSRRGTNWNLRTESLGPSPGRGSLIFGGVAERLKATRVLVRHMGNRIGRFESFSPPPSARAAYARFRFTARRRTDAAAGLLGIPRSNRLINSAPSS